MMKAVALLCLLLLGSAAGENESHMLERVFGFSSAFYENAIDTGGPTNGNNYVCDPQHLNQAQVAFSTALGIDSNFSWQNSTILYTEVDKFLAASIDNYVKTCQARTTFFQQMGSTYDDCTNPLYLTSLLGPGDNISLSFAYSALWKQLDFICNAGLDIGLQSFKDIMAVYGTAAAQKCYTQFSASVGADPTSRCTDLDTYIHCIQEAYIAYASNRPNGWWVCERARVGYGIGCLNLRCTVLTT